MDKANLRRIIENELFSLAGNEFQSCCDRLLSTLYPDDYTSVRAGGPRGDTKIDGYCPKARIFFAAHATRGEQTSATKKKIGDDLEGCLAEYNDVRKWIYLTNDTLLGEIHQFVEDLRKKHSTVVIELWNHKRLTDTVLSLKPSDVDGVLGFEVGVRIELTAEIDNAVQMLKKHKYLESIALLDRLWLQHNDVMSPRQKYRIKANMGHAYDGLAKWKDAARYFLDALQYDPEYEAARAREALAYWYLGNSTKAYELAEALLKNFPEEKLARAVLVRSAPKELDFKKVEEMVPDHQRKDIEVAMALGEAAMYKGYYEIAESYIGQALKRASSSPAIKETLGNLMLRRAGFLEQAVYDREPTKEELECLEKACSRFTEALAAYKTQNVMNSRVRVRLKRAATYQGQGNTEALEADITFAHQLDPSNSQAAFSYAQLKADREDYDTAISILESLPTEELSPDHDFLLARCFEHRNQEGDKEQAIKLLKNRLKDLGQIDPAIRAECVATLLDLERQVHGAKTALVILDTLPEDLLSTESLMVLKAELFRLDGDEDQATNVATDVLARIAPETTVQDKRRIAILLQALGMYSEALKLWKSIVKPEYIGRDTRCLIDCAYKCEDVDFVIEFSEKLRANGLWVRKLFDLELDYREKYNDDPGAKTVMLDFLDNPPDESYSPYVRLRLSRLGIRTEQKDLIEKDPSKLPQVEKVDTHVGTLVSQVLRYGDDPLRGVEYAYDLLRLHWDESKAHVGMFQVLLSPGPAVKIVAPEVVAPGVAVNYQEDDMNSTRWYIIEDSKVGKPDPARNEYPPNHPISLELLNKKQGEKFYLRKDELQSRTATIKRICSKYTYRHSDCLEQFETRFPGKNVVRRIILKEQAGKLDFSPLDRFAEQDDQQCKKLEEFYTNELVPIHLMADIRGRSVLEAINHIVSDVRLRLKCCKGTGEELEMAEYAIREADNLVLDITAICTLLLLQAHKRLLKIPKTLIISAGTLDELQKIKSSYDNPENLAGVYGKDGLIPYSPEAVKKAGEDLQELILLLQESCEVEPGLIVSKLESQRRKKLIRLFGQSVLESMMLAAGPKTALWTDDLATAEKANTDFGCRRVWTQFVVEYLCDEKQLEIDFTSQLALRLMQMGYYYTRPNVAVLMKAVEDTNGDIEKPPLAAALSWFGDPNVELEGPLRMGAVFIKEVWQKVQIQSVKQNITVRVLELLSSRSGGFHAISAWAQNIYNIFGLDVVNALQVRTLIEDWLKGSEGNRIIIP